MSKPLRVPEVGEFVRYAGTLVEVQVETPPPPPPVKSYVFERTQYQIEVRAAGKLLFEGPSFVVGTELQFAINEAIRIAKEYECEVDVVVIEVISRVRMTPNMNMPNIYHSGTPCFTFDPNPNRGMPADKVRDVWSSKKDLKPEDAT